MKDCRKKNSPLHTGLRNTIQHKQITTQHNERLLLKALQRYKKLGGNSQFSKISDILYDRVLPQEVTLNSKKYISLRWTCRGGWKSKLYERHIAFSCKQKRKSEVHYCLQRKEDMGGGKLCVSWFRSHDVYWNMASWGNCNSLNCLS